MNKPKAQRIRVAASAPACDPASEPGTAARRNAAPASDHAAARRVLELEAEGILAVARSLDRDPTAITRAVDLLARVTGRVIVSGMGKSGHIARKIAATLASTGTPAQFVHPAEASHGDLGMITRADAVLALSHSGETAEMADLLAFTRRFAIPLIGLTSGAGSQLAQAADVTLLLPPIREACPLGLAPTTSTTAALALGDALAVALFERKGFSADDFHQFHPKGALGRRFLRVSDLMHRGDAMPLIGATAAMADALVEMTAKRLGCVGVSDGEGRLVGIITDGDLRRHMSPSLLQQTVSTVMTAQPLTIRPQALAAEAMRVMNDANNGGGITNLFVVETAGREAGRPVGVLHIHDILRAGVA
ncbi:MAG: KpsF/GutQ family sugar-phosphate isomerase [Alphaproteobacteria bacterium]|nr:KpsF/GutQ family sugar-phosphate isomerase [Alphaproteobacteria bacterium]